MTANDARAKSLFLAASDLTDPAERDAFLDRECDGNSQLRERIEALLRANDAAPLPPLADIDATSAHPGPNSSPSTLDHHDRSAHVGSILDGKYKLMEAIGEGGMGRVFMAQQTQPVKRAVAVKVVKAGMDSKEVLARFEAERQALALMDHPNIAKVLDAGATEGGRPFFVMELVRGVPITQFCDERRLTPRQRLELFVPVCQAIQHAHQKGIIHRDIKPSNVLVAMYDDRAVPKVIDFGVAKAAGQMLTEKSLMTGFGAVVGTPEYMSPEQAQLNNLDIDARSDVYSLGVLLYELLTGTTPVDRKSLEKAAILEILRIVREEEAPRPSSKLSTINTLPSVAACRGVEPGRLSKLMAGELDWVVLKALEKDRTRRYGTANELGRDIQQYLSGGIVEARPPSTAYRLQKFIRQNKGPALAASLVLLAVLLGIAGSMYGLVRANWQRQVAEAKREEADQQRRRAETGEKLAQERLVQVQAARKKAEEEEAIARAVRDFLQNKLLAQAEVRVQADSIMQAGGSAADASANPTIQELLDRAAAELVDSKIETNFPNQPRLQAELLATVASVYFSVGNTEKAIGLLERSLALRKTHLGPEHADTLQTAGNLALSYHYDGQLGKAIPLTEETLRLCREHLGIAHVDTLSVMGNLAFAYRADGQMDKAVTLFEETLELRREHLGLKHPNTLVAMGNLASALQHAGQLEKALALFQETLELFREELGPAHPETLTCIGNLAYAYSQTGQLDLALPLLRETLELRTAQLGPKHIQTINSMNNLAYAYHASGMTDKALPLAVSALELLRTEIGVARRETITTMGVLAGIYRANGQLEKAIALVEEMLECQKSAFGFADPSISQMVGNLAVAYDESGQRTKALTLMDETLAYVRANLDDDHRSKLPILQNLGMGYWRMDEVEKAIDVSEELLALNEKTRGRDALETLSTAMSLGIRYKSAGRFAEAIPLLEEAYQARQQHPTLNSVSPQLLDGYVKTDQFEKALPLAKEQLDVTRRTQPSRSPQLAAQLAQYGLLSLKAKAFAKAEPVVRECLKIREQAMPGHWLVFNTQSMLGDVLLGQKKYQDAAPLLLEGYEGMKEREQTIPAEARIRLIEALQRLVQLNQAIDNKEQTAKWQAELDRRRNEDGPSDTNSSDESSANENAK